MTFKLYGPRLSPSALFSSRDPGIILIRSVAQEASVGVVLALGAGNFKLEVAGFMLDGIGAETIGAIVLYYALGWSKVSGRTNNNP